MVTHRELVEISWFVYNLLVCRPINYDKSCVMNCVTKKVLTLNSITTNNDTFLSTVTSLRLLGVTFSENLCWNLHVDDIVRRCYRRFFILPNLRRANCPCSYS